MNNNKDDLYNFLKKLKIITSFGKDFIVIHPHSTRIYRLSRDIYLRLKDNLDIPDSLIGEYDNLKKWGYLINRKRQRVYNQSIPILSLRISETCNLKCHYCFNKENMLNKKGLKFMSKETVKKAIEYFLKKSKNKDVMIVFTGGEPLLKFPLIEYAAKIIYEKKSKNQNVEMRISTNGTIINNKILRFISKNKTVRLLVSLDLPFRAHIKNRLFKNNSPSFERVRKNLELLCRSVDPQRLIVRSLAPEAPRFDLEDAYSDFYKLNLPASVKIGFSKETPNGSFCRLPTDNIDRFDREIICYNNKMRQSLSFIKSGSINYPKALVVDSWLHTIITGKEPLLACYAGPSSMEINPLGELHTCCRVVNIDEFCIGNIETGIDIKKVRSLAEGLISLRRQCTSCWASSLCGEPTCHLIPILYAEEYHKIRGNRCEAIRSHIIDSIRFIMEMNYNQIEFFLTSLMRSDASQINKSKMAVQIYKLLNQKNRHIRPVNIFPC